MTNDATTRRLALAAAATALASGLAFMATPAFALAAARSEFAEVRAYGLGGFNGPLAAEVIAAEFAAA